MAGWALCAAIVTGASVLLWRLGLPASLWTLALATWALGAAGYAWQGKPDWPEAPARPVVAEAADDETIALRSAMFGRYGSDAMFYTPADAMLRLGHTATAAHFLQGGINTNPRSVGLWTQLATVIATNDQAVSPTARFAFARAMALSPADPAPWFFLGQAQARSGDFVAARLSWRRALAMTPKTFGYRGNVATRLALLERFLNESAWN